MKFNPNAHLNCVLKSHATELEETLMRDYRQKRDEIQKALEKEFGAAIYNPIYSGSYAKHTGVNIKFDIDIAVPFQKKEYQDPCKMYNDVHDFLYAYQQEKDPQITQVTRQRRSINLALVIGGRVLDMDIVPGLEVKSYRSDHDLLLYDYKDSDTILTNIHKHIDHIKGRQDHNTEKRREVIKLMKVWKKLHYESAKSFLIELLVIDAFLTKPHLYHKKLIDRTLGVMGYIKEKIKSIRLCDPANPENVVTETLDFRERDDMRTTLENTLRDLERNPAYLEIVIPKNIKFSSACEPGAGRNSNSRGTTSYA